MTSESFVCDICGETESRVSPDMEFCCGKYCFVCMFKTNGLCYVCKKVLIDVGPAQMQCDMCGTIGYFFTRDIQMCAGKDGNCHMWVCKSCSKAGPEDPFRYCSYRHFK